MEGLKEAYIELQKQLTAEKSKMSYLDIEVKFLVFITMMLAKNMRIN